MRLKNKDFARFVSEKITAQTPGRFSSLIVKIAIGSVALGLSVMIVAYCVYLGYRTAISEKLYSIAAHIYVDKYDQSNNYESAPLSKNTKLYQSISDSSNFASIQSVALKPALLKTKEEVMGITLKGISEDFDKTLFEQNLVAGEWLDLSEKAHQERIKPILMSEIIANKLLVNLKDTLRMFFIQEPLRYRDVQVVGIYRTGIEDFDDLVVLGNIATIREVNNWQEDQVGGFEIFLKDPTAVEQAQEVMLNTIDYNMQFEFVDSKYKHFFDWFEMLNRNVVLFMFIILVVACFNVVSVLIIMIMERTQMIGILKALGASNAQIRWIFLHNGRNMIVKGLLIGNAIGLGLAFIQQQTKIIGLDVENYYIDHVPIMFSWPMILFFNLMTALIVFVVLILPTAIISRLRPVRSIKFN